jgi:hypothetical protein
MVMLMMSDSDIDYDFPAQGATSAEIARKCGYSLEEVPPKD